MLEDDSKWVLEGLRWVSELVSGSAGVVVWHRDVTLGDA